VANYPNQKAPLPNLSNLPRVGNHARGCPCIMWLKTYQQDLLSSSFSLNEEIDMAQNCPPSRLMSAFGTTHL